MISLLRSLLSIIFGVAKDTAGVGIAHQIFEIFSIGNIGKDYQRIKESSDEDNNLFTQLLARIYWSYLLIIDQKDYLKMKSWFITTSLFTRHENANYFSEIFRFLPEKYLYTLTDTEKKALELSAKEINNNVKYLLLSQLFQTLNNLEESQRTNFIKSSFYETLNEKNDPEIAAKEFVEESPLTGINTANQVYHAWGNFCDKLPELLKEEKNKNRVYSYKQSYTGKSLEAVTHDFINDFMNCIANQIKMEASGDTTGKSLDENSSVFIWMKKWLLLDDEQKIIDAVAIIIAPQKPVDSIKEVLAEMKEKMGEFDIKWTTETTQPGGLVNRIENLRKMIRGIQ